MKSEDNKFRYTTKKNDSKFFFTVFPALFFYTGLMFLRLLLLRLTKPTTSQSLLTRDTADQTRSDPPYTELNSSSETVCLFGLLLLNFSCVSARQPSTS